MFALRGDIIVLVIAFAHAGMHLLVFLFFLGLVGSSAIVVISFIEDLTELFGE
ncbi:hypothetical protein [Paracidobacterium acidisoli]|uniref:hypothetical protein n=1 Tax=Paracidobacterium acidisoli TaxID=2303751 RepID=UPI0013142943|nr:hypothetical protein [Paracidobacterium acidisoli]